MLDHLCLHYYFGFDASAIDTVATFFLHVNTILFISTKVSVNLLNSFFKIQFFSQSKVNFAKIIRRKHESFKIVFK